MKTALLLICVAVALSCCVTVASAQSSVECTFCQYLVGAAETFLANNSTDQEILQYLEYMCGFLPDPNWASSCKTVIATQGEALVEKIVNGDPPAEACAAIGLCNSSRPAVPIPVPVPVQVKNLKDDVACGVCTYIVGAVETYIQNNATESEILQFLENDCSYLGIKSWIATCQGTVKTFGPEIIQLVLAKQPADVVCTEIGLCNSSRFAAPKKIAAPAVKGNTTIGCNLCQLVVGYAEKFIAQNKTESEIIAGLNDVCTALPLKDWAATCTDLVSEYGDIIVSYLINEQPPAVLCTELKLCAPSASRVKPIPVRKH